MSSGEPSLILIDFSDPDTDPTVSNAEEAWDLERCPKQRIVEPHNALVGRNLPEGNSLRTETRWSIVVVMGCRKNVAMISLGDPTEISQEDIEGGLLDSCLKAISSKRRFQLSETVTILCYGHDLSEDDGHSIPRLDAVKTALKQSNIPFAPLEICKGNVEFKHWDSAIIDSPDDWNEFQGERRYQVSDLVNQA